MEYKMLLLNYAVERNENIDKIDDFVKTKLKVYYLECQLQVCTNNSIIRDWKD